MRKRRLITAVLAVLAATVAVIAVVTLPPASAVLAQPEPPGEDENGPGPAPPLFGPGGERGFGRGPGFPGGRGGLPPLGQASGGAALRISDDFVYVLHGSTLYQFAVEDLKLLKKVTLQEKPPFGPPGGRRLGPGGPRPGGRRPDRGERSQPRDR